MDVMMGIIVGVIIAGSAAALMTRWRPRNTNARRAPTPQPQAGTAGGGQAASSQPAFTMREALTKGPAWVIYVAISVWLLILVVKYCIAPAIVSSSVSKEQDVLPTFDFSEPTEGRTPATKLPAKPTDWRQEWIALTTKEIKEAYDELRPRGHNPPFLLVMDSPVKTVSIRAGNPYSAGQALLYGDPGHAWVTVDAGRMMASEIEVCQSVAQDRWQNAGSNPFRIKAIHGEDLILLRLKAGNATVTTTLITEDGQRNPSDRAIRPAVRFTLSGVPGKARPFVIANAIQTSLPSDHTRRVESEVAVIVVNHDGTALLPTEHGNALSILYGDHPWQVSGLKFTATTAGMNNPLLMAAVNSEGDYDIIVVLTPLSSI